MGAIASQITSLTIVYSTVYSDADQRKHQSSALLAFVRGIHRAPVNFPHKWPVARKMFPFDDVIMVKMRASPGFHMATYLKRGIWNSRFYQRDLCNTLFTLDTFIARVNVHNGVTCW